jgi:hypothetical protein
MRYPVRVVGGVVVGLAWLLLATSARSAVNPQLAGLQVALAKHALYSGAIDGELGPVTRTAIRRFQTAKGLVPDGIAGPLTRRALGRFGRPLFGARAIAAGMTGWDVAVLQFLLSRHRLLHGTPDGLFGDETRAALVRFQNARGLEPDGVVGPATAAALCRLSACAWAGHVASATPVTPASVRGLLDRWSSAYGVDRHLVRGIAWQESGYQPAVVSAHGAVGVMQLMPKTWVFVETFVIGHPVPATVAGNVQVGVAYVHYLLGRYGGDTQKALAAYNQGPASIETVGILPATRVYVDDVLALAHRL